MFPVSFSVEVIKQFTSPGARVLDPFAGRASSIFAAAALGRSGIGIELNPVGWLYGRVKLRPAFKEHVLKRIDEIARESYDHPLPSLGELDEFFHLCYSNGVLKFLLTARARLNWRTNAIDATFMAIILVYLHGKRDFSLSNQMRQGKAMSPDYAVKWWKEKGVPPPEIDLVPFLRTRVDWRYAKGRHYSPGSEVILGDSTRILKRIADRAGFDLLFTSPPYYNITNYHYDQWLRLWMLENGAPQRGIDRRWQGRFASRKDFQILLESVFEKSACLMNKSATVYVRTDAREFTLETTKNALLKAFPKKKLKVHNRPFAKATQTALFGDREEKPGEVDLILN